MITQDKNHIPWNKNHIPLPRKPELSFFDRKTSEALGTHHYLQAIFIVVDVFFKCLRQRSNGLKICLQAVFYMCFLGFIRYNKTFIACGFRKYENLFTHEYHIALKEYDTLGWIIFSHFPHQHAINVYYLLTFIY